MMGSGGKGEGEGTQKGGKSKGGKGGTQWKGKGKGKKDQRIHELNRQKNNGQMDLGNSGQNSYGRLKPTM